VFWVLGFYAVVTNPVVFLNIARQAELESAAVEGRLETLNLTSGSSVQVSGIFSFYFTYHIAR
jgi:hypothetical protein